MGSNAKPFLNESFLLDNPVSERLYFEYAADLPIIDYHNHLPPKQIAEDHRFENATEIWLDGDHYKWRALRALGIPEKYITGNASDEEKFQKWAEATPHTLRNPLYHWTHLELQRYFGITQLLNAESGPSIYQEINEKLQSPEYSVRLLLQKMKVEVVCTTDDPLDTLEFHQKAIGSDPKMLPAWRPDKAMAVESPDFPDYVHSLSKLSGIEIENLDNFLEALHVRHDFFHKNGCRLSDHGLNFIPFQNYSSEDVNSAFDKTLEGKSLTTEEVSKLKTFFLVEFGRMDHEKGWVQQYHLGALRNTNSRQLKKLGPDTGYDSIGDYPQAESLYLLLNELDKTDQLTKTILYNLNPSDNEVFATMAGNYNDGSAPGKMQFGSGWWYNDQLDGMERQINALSNCGLLSQFVGMLTDSRSFLSFPRHEYFRRLLCNILGSDIQRGMIPEDYDLVGKMVENICYYNARMYFDFYSQK